MTKLQLCLVPALVAAALASLTPGRARADIGAGIGANPLRLESQVQPGSRYQLPSVLVVNTGSQVSSYLVRVKRLGRPDGRDVPASWIRFARATIRLRPHKSAVIPVTLLVPKHAAHGVYRSNVVVSTFTPRPGGGAALGAAAADELSFAIGSPGSPLWLQSWFRYLVLALLASAATVFLVRRLGLQFRIELQRR